MRTGKYKPQHSSTVACTACPTGYATPSAGMTQKRHCYDSSYCAAGYRRNGHHWNPYGGYTYRCSACPMGQGLLKSRSQGSRRTLYLRCLYLLSSNWKG